MPPALMISIFALKSIMKANSYLLLQELKAITLGNIRQVETLQDLSLAQLNHKVSPESWSILECLEHLNLYAAFYHPHIDTALVRDKACEVFRPGFFGNYMVNMIRPKEQIKKMKTFEAMNPNGSALGHEVIKKFLENQNVLLDYLDRAQHCNLNKNKVPLTFTRLIHLKPGDALRFMVYHNQRHVLQAARNVKHL